MFRLSQKKEFFKEGYNFPYRLATTRNEKGEYPEMFYTRFDDSSAYNGQWVVGWLVKNGQELALEVIAASGCYDKVEELLLNENGKSHVVSDVRHIYHKFKPVKVVPLVT